MNPSDFRSELTGVIAFPITPFKDDLSLDSNGLRDFVRSIRVTESVLGDGVKRPTSSELKNMTGIRRSVVAARAIPKGTVLTRELLLYVPGSFKI